MKTNSSKKILIVGLGIGNLYKTILKSRYEVFTVDINKDKFPTFSNLDEALECHRYDLAIICVPNYLHEEIAQKLDGKVSVILVEKPGFETEDRWRNFLKNSPSKIVMVKNNIFRENLEVIKKEIHLNIRKIEKVYIIWLNKNRIPNPGSWFTNKKLSFGGVERDLVPHLLSIYHQIIPKVKEDIELLGLDQYNQLSTLSSTEYGNVDPNGTFDVPDCCEFTLGNKFKIYADWATFEESKIGVDIEYKDGRCNWHEFGLCPEECYLRMVEDVLDMDERRYKFHNNLDLFIHRIIDNLYV